MTKTTPDLVLDDLEAPHEDWLKPLFEDVVQLADFEWACWEDDHGREVWEVSDVLCEEVVIDFSASTCRDDELPVEFRLDVTAKLDDGADDDLGIEELELLAGLHKIEESADGRRLAFYWIDRA